jgi:hypothetical protein
VHAKRLIGNWLTTLTQSMSLFRLLKKASNERKAIHVPHRIKKHGKLFQIIMHQQKNIIPLFPCSAIHCCTIRKQKTVPKGSSLDAQHKMLIYHKPLDRDDIEKKTIHFCFDQQKE